MKKINKLIAGVASAAMIVTAFSACGSASSSGKKLDFITGMATGSVHLKTLQSITDEFEKANPGVEINLIPASQDFTNDIKVRLAAKNAPDLWNTHGWSRDRYAKFLEPLQNRSWASKMKPITKEAFMEDDGTFYALPLDIQVTGVLYNKDVLDKVGVDPNELNTWDEFNDACQKVKDAGLTCVVAGGKDTAIAGDLADLTASSWYNDGELKKLQKGKSDSSVYQKESGLIEGWAKKGYFNPDYTSATQDDIEKLMANGQAAFYFRSNLHASQIQTFNSNVNLGFMATPTESGDRYVTLGEDWAVGASKTGKNKDIALKYIDFLAKPANMTKLTKMTNNDSALKGVNVNLGKINDTYNYWVNEKSSKTVPFFDRMYLPDGMWDTLCKSTDGLITGQLNAKSAADQMSTNFTTMWAKKNA